MQHGRLYSDRLQLARLNEKNKKKKKRTHADTYELPTEQGDPVHNRRMVPSQLLSLQSHCGGDSITVTTTPLTLYLLEPVKLPGWKMHARTCKQFIFRSFNTSTFSATYFDDSPFTCRYKKEGKKAEGLQILYFYWSFSNDIMVVKGLIASFMRSQLWISALVGIWFTTKLSVRPVSKAIQNICVYARSISY